MMGSRMGAVGTAASAPISLSELDRLPLASLSIGDLLQLALDPDGFVQREEAIKAYITQQNEARQALEAAEHTHAEREAEVAKRETALKEAAGTYQAQNADLSKREAALADHTRALSEDMTRREESLAQDQRALATDRQAFDDSRAQRVKTLETELAEKRSADERRGWETRTAAQAEINDLRAKAEQEIAAARNEMTTVASEHETALATREERVLARERALEERLSQLRAVLPA